MNASVPAETQEFCSNGNVPTSTPPGAPTRRAPKSLPSPGPRLAGNPVSLVALVALFTWTSLSAQTSTQTPLSPAEESGTEQSRLDILKFNGTGWHASNNTQFFARFEKYLSTPEESGEAEESHRRILNQIASLLEPKKVNPTAISTAFRLLTRATYFPGDSRLSDTLANGIYAIWQAKRNSAQLQEANRILEEESRALAKNMASASRSGTANRPGGAFQQANRAGSILEKGSKMTANEALSQLSEIQAKVSYQGLLVQLFLQRRFHHLVIGSRFYRAIYDDGNSQINLSGNSANSISGRNGSPPSVQLLENLANEAIRDVQSASTAFYQHLEKKELRGATEKLREALLVGEFLPELRTIPLEKKRTVLGFLQKSVQLQSSLDSKDYTHATELLTEIRQSCTDFDETSARAALAAAKQALDLHLQQARVALSEGNKTVFEKQIAQAAQVWPNNPDLHALSAQGFRVADEISATLREFESLIARNDFRRISEQGARFLAALHGAPSEKQMKLREALDLARSVEGALALAAELNQRGNPARAWETVFLLSQKIPEETRLNAAIADYASRAVEFVTAVQTAQKFEQEAQLAPSVAWYLKARKLNPDSVLVQQSLLPACLALLHQQP